MAHACLKAHFWRNATAPLCSLITDNAAQFNNARQGRADDELWRPQPKGLPALDSNGTVVIRVLQNVKKSKGAR